MITIVAVLQKETKGQGNSFICKGDDGNVYWVKALGAQRNFQINEWIAGCLAKELGLPIAEFCIVDIPFTLYKIAPPEWKELIGYGPAFASRQVINAMDAVATVQSNAPIDLKRRLLIFDYWVQNGDRNVGNPNVLWANDQTHIIDHNLAFDPAMDESEFFSRESGHIFAAQIEQTFGDLACIAEHKPLLERAMDVFDTAVASIPPMWFYHDLACSQPIEDNLIEEKRSILERYLKDEFWGSK